MDQVANILPKTFSKLGLHKKFRSEMILYRWEDIVGTEIASHARPISLQFGFLLVAVNNSVWLHHLSLMTEELIQKLNNFAEMQVVKQMKFQAGAVKVSAEAEGEQPELSLSRKVDQILLTSDEVEEIRQIIGDVKTEALQKQLFSLLVKEKRLRKYKLSHQYHPCKSCGALCPPDEPYCFICSLQVKQERLNKICSLLYDAPWLSYIECRKILTLTHYEYNRAKEHFIKKLTDQLNRFPAPPLAEESLVMLLTGTKPENLTNDLIARTMTRVRRKKHVFAFRK